MGARARSGHAAVSEASWYDGALFVRIVKGVHSGAVIPLTESGILVIGAGEDCDVILADEGVTGHHCLLTSRDGKSVLRAIGGTLTLNGDDHGPGATIILSPGAVVGLAGAAFEVTTRLNAAVTPAADRAHPNTETLAATLPVQPTRALGRFGWGLTVALAAATACALGAVGFTLSDRSNHMAANEVQAADPAEARSGETVAHDVAEVLRLSGIVCKAQYTSEGTVSVSGHLGDPRALQAIIQSRAMREIGGLKRVIAMNLDNRDKSGELVSGTLADGARIVSVIVKKDPYVVTADGSRYYLGASLPQGGLLVGVREGDVLVERNGEIVHLKLSDTRSADNDRLSLNRTGVMPQ
jgi:Inner membrane component of T3SS, cytoplasmic domain